MHPEVQLAPQCSVNVFLATVAKVYIVKVPLCLKTHDNYNEICCWKLV